MRQLLFSLLLLTVVMLFLYNGLLERESVYNALASQQV